VTCWEVVPPVIDNCIFSHNIAVEEGGAVVSLGGSPLITSCLFVDNSADRGGAVAGLGLGEMRLEGCVFEGNSATDGGAVLFDYAYACTLTSCTFAANQAPRGAGISVVSCNHGPIVLAGSIFAFGAGGEGFYWDGVGDLTLSCLDIYGNEGGDWVGFIADQADSNGNFAADPLFCAEPGSGEPLTIAAESPCAPDNNPDCGLVGALPVGCTVSGFADPGRAPGGYRLHPGVPNPFNPSTTIGFDLPRPEWIDLRIFDVSGRLVRVLVGGQTMAAGRHQVVWNGQDARGRTAAAGVYFCRLEAGAFSAIARLTMVK